MRIKKAIGLTQLFLFTILLAGCGNRHPYYSARQLTSYDRRSVIPNTPSWHANDDWAGFVRYEANNGRVEKVLFDEEGPGVITRIITTGGDQDTNLRFYFDDEPEASIVIPGYDIARFPIAIPEGMICIHEHYPTTKGCSFYYPLPYKKRCKITVDNLNRPYVYHVNYRAYETGTTVETFTLEEAGKQAAKAKETGDQLLNPREDDEASRGYNTFVRTRNLDGIPFNRKLNFEFELVSWDGGAVDYSSTVYWYGDLNSKMVNPSPKTEALYVLPPAIYTGQD